MIDWALTDWIESRLNHRVFYYLSKVDVVGIIPSIFVIYDVLNSYEFLLAGEPISEDVSSLLSVLYEPGQLNSLFSVNVLPGSTLCSRTGGDN